LIAQAPQLTSTYPLVIHRNPVCGDEMQAVPGRNLAAPPRGRVAFLLQI
jgi:hypothetical protein